MYVDDQNVNCSGLGLRTVACGFGHWSGHWDYLSEGQLDDWCWFTRYSWSGTALLDVYCPLFEPANWKNGDQKTRDCTGAELHDSEKHAS